MRTFSAFAKSCPEASKISGNTKKTISNIERAKYQPRNSIIIEKKNIGFSKNFSLRIIEDFFEIITSDLIKKNSVKISSFGTFKIMNKKERIGRNPKTKIETKISARKGIKFIPSDIFKKKINQK